MDSADQDPDHDDLDTKKCFVTIQKLNMNIDDYDSDSSIDLPPLPYLLNSSSTKPKRKSGKTTAELLKEHQNLANNLKVDCASDINIDETLKRLEVIQIETIENEDSLPESPVSSPTQDQEQSFHVFLVHDTLQFFNSRDVTPSKCGFDTSNPITEYEKEMLSFKRVEFEHVISSFLFSSNTFCISDLKSFTTYLLRNLSIHVDVACLGACYDALISLLDQHPDAKNLTFNSAEIFMILFNYGTDINSFLFLREWPDVLESLEQSHERKKNYKEIPGKWTVNFKYTLKAVMEVISTCKFKTKDLIKTIVYFLWMTLDSTLHKENLYSYVRECIFVALEQVPEEKWNKVLGVVSKTLLSLEFSSKPEKWSNLSLMVESIPNNCGRGVQLRRLISFSALKCLCLQIYDLDVLVFDIYEFHRILEQLSDVDSSLLCVTIKFVDICVKHLNATKEDYKDLLNVLKQCEANINENAHDAKTHLMKIHAKLKIFSGGNIYKVSGGKSLTRKIKEEKFLEEYIENEPDFSNIDEVDQVDDVHDTTIISTKIKVEQNYESSVGSTACDQDEVTLNSLIPKTSFHFETETQSQLSPGLVKDEYSRRSIKEEMNINRESTSGSYEEKQINFTSRCHDTLPIIASVRPESENLVAEYGSELFKITQIKSEFDIENQSSFIQPLIAEVKSISSNSAKSSKQSDNCLSDVVCDSNNELLSDRNVIQEPSSPQLCIAEVKSLTPSDTEVFIQPEISVSNLQQIIAEVKAISSNNTKSLKQSSNCLADVVCDSELISNRNFIQETPLLKFSSAEIKSIAPSDTKVLIEQPEISVSNLQQIIAEVKAISSNNNTKCLKQSANNLPDVVCDSNEFMSNRNFIQEPPSLKFSSAVIKPVVPSGTKVSIEQPEISVSNLTYESSDTSVPAETSLHPSTYQEPIVVDIDSPSHADKAVVRQSTNPAPDLLDNFVKNLVTDENSIYHSLLPEISIMKTKSSTPDNIELLESFSRLTSDLQSNNKDLLELCKSAGNAVAAIVQKNPDLVISKVNDPPISKEKYDSTSVDNDIVFIEEFVSPSKRKSPLKPTKISPEKKNDSFKEPDIIILEKINPGKNKKSKSPLKVDSEKLDKPKYTETWIDDEFTFVTACEITVIKPHPSESGNDSQNAEDTSEISVIEVVENKKTSPSKTKINENIYNNTATISDISVTKDSSKDKRDIVSQCDELLNDVVEYIDDIAVRCDISSKKDSSAEERVNDSQSNQPVNNAVEYVDVTTTSSGILSKKDSSAEERIIDSQCSELLTKVTEFVDVVTASTDTHSVNDPSTNESIHDSQCNKLLNDVTELVDVITANSDTSSINDPSTDERDIDYHSNKLLNDATEFADVVTTSSDTSSIKDPSADERVMYSQCSELLNDVTDFVDVVTTKSDTPTINDPSADEKVIDSQCNKLLNNVTEFVDVVSTCSDTYSVKDPSADKRVIDAQCSELLSGIVKYVDESIAASSAAINNISNRDDSAADKRIDSNCNELLNGIVEYIDKSHTKAEPNSYNIQKSNFSMPLMGLFKNSVISSVAISDCSHSNNSISDKIIDSHCNELLNGNVEYVDRSNIASSTDNSDFSYGKDSMTDKKIVDSNCKELLNGVVKYVHKSYEDISVDKLECNSKDFYSKDNQSTVTEDCKKLLDALLNIVSTAQYNYSVSIENSNNVSHLECNACDNSTSMDSFKNNTLEHQNLSQNNQKCSDSILLSKTNVPNESDEDNSANASSITTSHKISTENQLPFQDDDKNKDQFLEMKKIVSPVKENINIKRGLPCNIKSKKQLDIDEISELDRSPMKGNLRPNPLKEANEQQLKRNEFSDIEEERSSQGKRDLKRKQTTPLKKTTEQQLGKEKKSCIEEVVSPVKENLRRKQTKPSKKAHQTEILMSRLDFHKKEVKHDISFKREHPGETLKEISTPKRFKSDRKQSNPLKKEHQTEILMSLKDYHKKDKAVVIDVDVVNVLQDLVKDVISLTDFASEYHTKLESNSCSVLNSNFSMPLTGLFKNSIITSSEPANVQKSKMLLMRHNVICHDMSDVTNSEIIKLKPDDINGNETENQSIISDPEELEVFTEDINFPALTNDDKALDVDGEKTTDVNDENIIEVDVNDENIIEVDVNDENIIEVDVENEHSTINLQSVEHSQPISNLSDFNRKKKINQPTQILKNSNNSGKRELISLESAWHSHMLPSARKSFPNKNNRNSKKRRSSEFDSPSSKILKKTSRSNFDKNENNCENLKVNKRLPGKFSPQKSALCGKYKNSKSPKKFFDYTQMKHKYDCLKKNKRKTILNKVGSNLANILREKMVSSSSENKNEIYLSDSDDSDIMELYTDPKRYADKECLVIYESENVIVLD